MEKMLTKAIASLPANSGDVAYRRLEFPAVLPPTLFGAVCFAGVIGEGSECVLLSDFLSL